MYLIILWVAKFIQLASRKGGHGGAALPGLFVEKISKNFLKHYLSKIPDGVIVISGTNGKTTTTKLLVEPIEGLGKRVFTNRSGSNMTRGLISAVIDQSNMLGFMPYDIAILEVDEAYASILSDSLKVRGSVILNVMRDQLDRFGEIDNTAKLLGHLSSNTNEFVILNASDSRVINMPTNSSAKRIMFGMSKKIKKDVMFEDSFHNKNNNEKEDIASYKLTGSVDNRLEIEIEKKRYTLSTNLTGVHNHLNVAAALACLKEIGYFNDLGDILKSIEKVTPAFGRGEIIKVGDSNITIQLIKNPGSFMQNLSSSDIARYESASIFINDAYADGRDVSWLWDVEFSKFAFSPKLFLGGSRAYDLAVRIKHENIKPTYINTDIDALAKYIISTPGENVIFCTYTAMLKLRKIFVKKGHARRVL